MNKTLQIDRCRVGSPCLLSRQWFFAWLASRCAYVWNKRRSVRGLTFRQGFRLPRQTVRWAGKGRYWESARHARTWPIVGSRFWASTRCLQRVMLREVSRLQWIQPIDSLDSVILILKRCSAARVVSFAFLLHGTTGKISPTKWELPTTRRLRHGFLRPTGRGAKEARQFQLLSVG
jgi:hypothetical protein